MIAIALPLLTGCSDDDPVINEDLDEEKEETADVTDILANRLVMNLCEIDSAGPLEILTPRLGEALDGVPTELSCSMDDEEAALEFFCTNMADMELGKDYINGTESLLTYDLGRHGTVTYSRGREAGEIAQISFDMPRLSSAITVLHILTPEAWPENNDSPYGRGDVLLEKVNGKEYYWLVVREYQSGCPGIMMTVDYGWETTTRSDHYKSYTSYKGCAGKDAWDAMADWWFLKNDDFKRALVNIQNIEKNKRHGKRFGYVTDLLTRTVSIDRGEENVYQYGDTWDNKYYWWSKVRHVWESRSYYVVLGKRSQFYNLPFNNLPFLKDFEHGFEAGSYYFKRSQSPVVPQHRNSHARYFTAYEKEELELKYEVVYANS